MRAVAQTLAQRTHCFLMLGQPGKALPELALLNAYRHLLEGAPTGQPMTLVAAMINVAVTGVYAQALPKDFSGKPGKIRKWPRFRNNWPASIWLRFSCNRLKPNRRRFAILPKPWKPESCCFWPVF